MKCMEKSIPSVQVNDKNSDDAIFCFYINIQWLKKEKTSLFIIIDFYG